MPSPAWTLLRIFNAYHVYWYEEGDPIGDDWTSITAQEFKVGLRYHFATTGNCCTETVAYK